MNAVMLIKRLVKAGVTVTAIERECGFGRSRLARLIEGTASLSAEERERLEEFAAGFLPKGAMSPPHHERCPPRFGR